jgi:hypothetical protein
MGAGQIVADYSGPGAKPFTHRRLTKTFDDAVQADG